jgi:hypothetical protein
MCADKSTTRANKRISDENLIFPRNDPEISLWDYPKGGRGKDLRV